MTDQIDLRDMDPMLIHALANAWPDRLLGTRCRDRECMKLHFFAHHYGDIAQADLQPCEHRDHARPARDCMMVTVSRIKPKRRP